MDLLGERQAQLFLQYNQRLNSLEFDDKIKESSKIRDEEGYMAESKKWIKKIKEMEHMNYLNIIVWYCRWQKNIGKHVQ